MIPGVRALARRVEETGAWDTDRFGDASAADCHMGAADAERHARAGAREVHGQAGTQMHAAVEAQAHAR